MKTKTRYFPKVGDRVKCVDDTGTITIFYGLVVHASGNVAHVERDDGQRGGGIGGSFVVFSHELVLLQSVEQARAFAEADTVFQEVLEKWGARR